MGIVSALGIGVKENLLSLKNRTSGIELPRFLDASLDFPVGEVKYSNMELKKMLSDNSETEFSRTSLLGIIAVKEALKSAEISEEKLGLISGTTVNGKDIRERHYGIDYDATDPEQYSISSTNQIADYFNCFDYASTISTACSSALNAIMNAAIMVELGIKDIIVAGGSECLSICHYHGFSSLKILDRKRCCPFDKKRAGINLGEGAGYIVIESVNSAKKRGIKPLVTIDGYGNACDAYHHTASSPDGEGAFLAMQRALNMSNIQVENIQYINAHGTGTSDNDKSESKAIMRLFGERIPAVSSTKGYTGHTTSACGAIELIFCILSIINKFIPVSLGYQDKDAECIVPYMHNNDGVTLYHVMCNSFGFGGNDSSIIISKVYE